jgi:hypothetical protein
MYTVRLPSVRHRLRPTTAAAAAYRRQQQIGSGRLIDSDDDVINSCKQDAMLLLLLPITRHWQRLQREALNRLNVIKFIIDASFDRTTPMHAEKQVEM